MSDREVIEALTKQVESLTQKVDVFERVIRWFVELPAIYMSPTFSDLLSELGYEIRDSESGIKRLVRTDQPPT